MSRRIRFHGGPYDGRVEDIPDDTRSWIDVPVQSTQSFVRSGLGSPHATVGYNILTYELVKRRDGSWHAHTKRGMKMMRRNAERRDLVNQARGCVISQDFPGALDALSQLERRL